MSVLKCVVTTLFSFALFCGVEGREGENKHQHIIEKHPTVYLLVPFWSLSILFVGSSLVPFGEGRGSENGS